jgi:hypothetical protein
MPLSPDDPKRVRALKLLHLSLRGVGGEQRNAARLLLTHLQTHDLTLYDIDPGLPVTQDLAVLPDIQEAQLHLAKLGTDDQDMALTLLVDDSTLTLSQIERVLDVLDLSALGQSRAQAWAHLDQGDEQIYLRLTSQIRPADLQVWSGSIAERLRTALHAAAWSKLHPLRLLRVTGDLDQALVQGFVQGLGASQVRLTSEGVQGHLSAEQLARTRTWMIQDLHGVRIKALSAVNALAAEQARRIPPLI